MLDIASMYCRTPNVELETVFHSVTKDEFLIVTKQLAAWLGQQPVVSERLDVNVNGTRFSFFDKASAEEYSRHATLSNAKTIKVETKKLIKRVFAPENALRPFTINLKLERRVNPDFGPLFDRRVPPLNRFVRHMKRLTWTHLPLRFDLSIVRSVETTAYKIADVPKDEFQMTYEVEIEVIDAKEAGGPAVVAAIEAGIEKLTGFLVAASRRQQEDDEDKNKEDTGEGSSVAADADALDRRITAEYVSQLELKFFRFIGPSPVTLEKINMLDEDVDVISIKTGYLVTEKADGTHALLYVSPGDRSAYYVTRSSPRWTLLREDCPEEIAGSLLDCELIRRQDGSDMLLAFDIFFLGKRPVAQLPLSEDGVSTDDGVTLRGVEQDRIACMDSFAMVFESNAFRLKKYRPVEHACKILDEARLGVMIDYEIDGLIYAPAALPIGGHHPGDLPKCYNSWSRVFKWKPPELNSIDFLVDVVADSGIAYLYMDWAPTLSPESVSPADFYAGKFAGIGGHRPDLHNNRVLFEPMPTVNLKRRPRTGDEGGKDTKSGKRSSKSKASSVGGDEFVAANGDVIESGMIVEFSYSLQTKTFAAMRVRNDKEENRANSYKTAMQVWRTIQNPVTEDNVCFRAPIAETKEELMEDKYWLREINVDSVASFPMIAYHRWIKGVMIDLTATLAQARPKLLDLCCGKGGDLARWKASGIAQVLGVDYYDDSITNGSDGVLARMINYGSGGPRGGQQHHHPRTSSSAPSSTPSIDPAFKHYYFARWDVSYPMTEEAFDTAPFESDNEAQHRNVLRAAYGIASPIKLPTAVAVSGFDIVTCMFSIHYFFGEKAKLDAFVDNVARNLRSGGVFAGCCFAAERVLELLGTRDKVEGRADDGRLMWQISREVSKDSKASKEASKEFGRQIDVYVDSINKKTPEFLVDFDLLQQALIEKGIELFETATFDVPYEEYLRLRPESAPLTDAQKQYSFLNRYFVFRKK